MSVLSNAMMMGQVNIDLLLPTALAWYDASNDAYLDLSGSNIVKFLDRTGKGNHTNDQATGSARMTRTASEQNGLATAIADGSDFYTLPSALLEIGKNSTIFLVGKCTNTSAVRYFLSSTGTGTATRYFLRSEANAGGISYTTSAASSNRVTVSGITKSSYNIICSRSGGVYQRLACNDGLVSSNNNGLSGTSTNATIGAYTGAVALLIGGIGEIIIFSRTLTNQEMEAVTQYLSNKWAITLV